MKFNILTLFPEMFTPLKTSMLGRATENGLLEINIINPRDYSKNKHKKVDDYPFGGAQGMVMMPQPLFDCIRENSLQNSKIYYMSPRGKLLDFAKIKEISSISEATVLCGHYEGVDQRVLDEFDVEEISIGDYVLTGGELAAMVLVDTVARMIPGVLSGEESALEESIYSGLLEHDQYTQPRDFEGTFVPEVLYSGNHGLINLWKLEESMKITLERRPELLRQFLEDENNWSGRSKAEKKVMEKYLQLL
ncbi:tRNA (guanine-N1)-methyltransferase [Clostridiales bacterium S5-A14a]|nr:tRNA (guanine-N1)-methyltransferase [Clostridiales bacterium S5-A14a]